MVNILANGFVPIIDYGLFKGVEYSSFAGKQNNGVRFFAGDYWKAWPAVMRELLNGGMAYGFSYRSQGNIQNLNKSAEARLNSDAAIEVYCLNDSIESCKNQVFSL